MINIKGFAVATDGTMKRVAITYDEIDNEGKVTNGNQKINRVVTDSTVLDAITTIENFAKTIVSA